MHRQYLIHLLQEYFPENNEELVAKKQILEFVQQHEDCFERSLQVGHVSASAWLLNRSGTHALLTHHAKLDYWVQLGGHCDGESNVLAVAIREAQEESGIQNIVPVTEKIFDIGVHFFPERDSEPEHLHYNICFLLQVTSDEEIIVSHESKALRWVSKDPRDLPTQDASVLRMHQKWRNWNGVPVEAF